MKLPEDLLVWFKTHFAECNLRISTKLALNPNTPEPSLDNTFIEYFTHLASPRRLGSGATVKIETHYLGGLRHFVGRWEIADIGILVHYFEDGVYQQSKAAVLQSKRLYPRNQPLREDHIEDYMIGFGRLADPEDLHGPPYMAATFQFDEDCTYAALRSNDDQAVAIREWVKSSKVPVYYQFYNPPNIPHTITVPLVDELQVDQQMILGTRISPAADVLARISGIGLGSTPSIRDLAGLQQSALYFGWSLEYFVAGLLLPCREGYRYTDHRDQEIFRLFNRRAGPIAAAIAFSIDTPRLEE